MSNQVECSKQLIDLEVGCDDTDVVLLGNLGQARTHTGPILV